MKKAISVLIVDDEPLAGDSVEILLQREPDFNVIGKVTDGLSAINFILTNKVDLLFLDIQMPEISGFDVLSAIPKDEMPAIIFVTAHDQFALRAFEVNALDYLLKPYSDKRFYEALSRVRSKLENGLSEFSTELINLLSFYRSEQKVFRKRLAVREKNKFVLLDISTLVWARANGSYTEIKSTSSKHIISQTLGEFETDLDPAQFLRIHRSTIVNLSCIREMEPYFNREYFLTMNDGSRFKISRHYKEQASRILSGK